MRGHIEKAAVSSQGKELFSELNHTGYLNLGMQN